MAPDPSLQSSSTTSTSSSSGIGSGAIAGIVAGVLLLLVVSCSLFAFLRRRRVRESQPRHSVIATEQFFGKAGGGVRSYPGAHHKTPSDLVGMAPLLEDNQPNRPRAEDVDTREQQRPYSVYGSGVSPVSAFVNTYYEQDLGTQQTHANSLSDATPFLSLEQSSTLASITSPPIRFEVPSKPVRFPHHPEPSFPPPPPPVSFSTASEHGAQRSVDIPPISIPQYPTAVEDPEADSASITHSAASDDTGSVYSQRSASTYAGHKSAGIHSGTFPIPPVPPLPPLPPLPTHLQPRRIELRDVGLPDYPVPSGSQSNKLLDRSETRVIGALIKSRAARVADTASASRTFSNAEHIERAGSIKPAVPDDSLNEESFNSRLAKVKQARAVKDVQVHVPMQTLEEGQTSDSTTAANWSESARVPKAQQPIEFPSPLMPLTGAFEEALMSPPTPPSQYPYFGGSAPFFAATSPLKITKAS